MLIVGDPRAAADGPYRRRLGALLLVAGLLAILLISGSVRPGIAGSALAAPLPAPPPVGSCLLLEARALTSTSCTAPHNAEVTRAWAATDPLPGGTRPLADFTSSARGEESELCHDQADRYLQYSSTDDTGNWVTVKPEMIARLIAAPPAQRTGTQAWRACVVASPGFQLYTGTVHGGYSSDLAWSSIFGLCVPNRAQPDLIGACDARHPIEVLGVLNKAAVIDDSGMVRDTIAQSVLQDSCKVLAVNLTGSPDPTFGGQLLVTAAPLVPSFAFDGLSEDEQGELVPVVVPASMCFVEVAGDEMLTSTIIGLRDNPVPIG